MPKWCIIWLVGILSTLQDMTIDPVYVNDTYVFDGVEQGHWNWTIYYDTTFFGILIFNFSSWFFMTGLYAGLMLLGRHFYEKKKKEWIGICYPFISAVLLMICLVPTAIVLIVKYWKKDSRLR